MGIDCSGCDVNCSLSPRYSCHLDHTWFLLIQIATLWALVEIVDWEIWLTQLRLSNFAVMGLIGVSQFDQSLFCSYSRMLLDSASLPQGPWRLTLLTVDFLLLVGRLSCCFSRSFSAIASCLLIVGWINKSSGKWWILFLHLSLHLFLYLSLFTSPGLRSFLKPRVASDCWTSDSTAFPVWMDMNV